MPLPEGSATIPPYVLEHVTKGYGGVMANDDISLSIGRGEIFGLLGPNGAGKSTLVRQMVGLVRPDRGQVRYDGRLVVPGDRALRRRVAYLSQRPLALLDLTVREAVVFTGQLRGLSAPRALHDAEALIEELGLAQCAGRIVATLSGGQHRLVALASALVGEAETLVLDEPTNELDPAMRRQVWAELRARCHRGATVVLVTHNALEAEQVIERLAVLMHGCVIAYGTPGEIKAGVDSRLRIELTFRTSPDGVLNRLERLGTLVHTAPNRVVVTVPRQQVRRTIENVLDVVSLDELDDFRVLTPTLEDVYLQVAAPPNGLAGPDKRVR